MGKELAAKDHKGLKRGGRGKSGGGNGVARTRAFPSETWERGKNPKFKMINGHYKAEGKYEKGTALAGAGPLQRQGAAIVEDAARQYPRRLVVHERPGVPDRDGPAGFIQPETAQAGAEDGGTLEQKP